MCGVRSRLPALGSVWREAMKVATLLIADVHDADHGCCAAECPDLDAGFPTACVRFGVDGKCVPLHRGKDHRRIVRCPECIAAENRLREIGDGDNPNMPRYSEGNLRDAVDELCSCGGCGPDDPEACPVCKMWHLLTTGWVTP